MGIFWVFLYTRNRCLDDPQTELTTIMIEIEIGLEQRFSVNLHMKPGDRILKQIGFYGFESRHHLVRKPMLAI